MINSSFGRMYAVLILVLTAVLVVGLTAAEAGNRRGGRGIFGRGGRNGRFRRQKPQDVSCKVTNFKRIGGSSSTEEKRESLSSRHSSAFSGNEAAHSAGVDYEKIFEFKRKAESARTNAIGGLFTSQK